MTETVFDLRSREFRSNPYPQLKMMLAAGAIVPVRLPLLGRVRALTTYAAVDEFLRDSDHFTREPARAGRRLMAGAQWWMPRFLRALGQNMLTFDGDRHRRLRLLVEQAFVRNNVEAMRSRIGDIADGLIDRMERLEVHNGSVDFLEHFARPLPLIVISELLGLPHSDRPKFMQWFAPISKVSSVPSFMKTLPGIWRLRRYLIDRIAACRRASDSGLISSLVNSDVAGDALDDDELLAMIILLLTAGHETTSHLLALGLLALIDHPQESALLQEDWSKADQAVQEILRYMSPVQMSKPRFAAEDMQLHGKQIKRGDVLIALLAAANIDPEEFPNPERFMIDRSPNRHVGFGKGIHTCLGMRMANVETQIAFQRLFSRHPHVRLAIHRNEIRWSSKIGMRSVEALPITFPEP